jgi:hypothetical protein
MLCIELFQCLPGQEELIIPRLGIKSSDQGEFNTYNHIIVASVCNDLSRLRTPKVSLTVQSLEIDWLTILDRGARYPIRGSFSIRLEFELE